MPECSFVPADLFILRSSVMPLHIGDALVEDLLGDDVFRAALTAASPGLDEALERSDGTAHHAAVRRYIRRARSSAVPFGLWAGITVGRVGEPSASAAPFTIPATGPVDTCDIRADTASAVRRQLADCVTRIEEGLTEFIRVNPSTVVGDRFVGAQSLPEFEFDGGFQYIGRSTALTYLLSLAPTSDPVDAQSIAVSLASRFTQPVDRARALVASCVRSGLLIPERLGSTVWQPLSSPTKEPATEWGTHIRALRSSAPDGTGGDRTRSRERDTVHADTRVAISNMSLSPDIATTVARAASFVLDVSRLDTNNKLYMRRYCDRFTEHYGQYTMVPISQLVDSRFGGLGPPQTYTRPSHADHDPAMVPHLDTPWLRYSGELLARAENGAVQVGPADLSGRYSDEQDQHEIYPYLDVFAEVGRNGATVFRDDLFAFGGCSTNRFGRLLTESERSAMDDLRQIEQTLIDPEALHAVVACLPLSSRSSNVISASPTRPYIVPINIVPDELDPDRVIDLSDLLVSSDGHTMMLWSTSKQRRVVVHHDSMINPQLLPNAARLLLEISKSEFLQPAGFTWPEHYRAIGPLPRVTFEETVLLPAQLHLMQPPQPSRPSSWEQVVEKFLDRTDAVDLVTDAGRVRFDQPVSGAELLSEAQHLTRRGERSFFLEERSAAWDGLVTTADGSAHRSEVVLPILSREPTNTRRIERLCSRARIATAASISGRKSDPEWVALHVYAHPSDFDEIIRDLDSRLTNRAEPAHAATPWFFVRYADHRGHHLRVRVNREYLTTLGSTVDDVTLSIRSAAQSVSAVISEDYYPEDARFGGRSLREPSRATFTASRELVTRFLHTAASGRWSAHSFENLAMLFAVGSTALILDAFGTTAAAVVGSPDLGKDGRDQWSTLGDDLKEVVRPWSRSAPNVGTDMHAWLTSADKASLWRSFETFGTALRSSSEESDDQAPIFGSILHMHSNRIIAGARSFEPTSYALLTRVIRTLQGRPDASDRTGTR